MWSVFLQPAHSSLIFVAAIWFTETGCRVSNVSVIGLSQKDDPMPVVIVID